MTQQVAPRSGIAAQLCDRPIRIVEPGGMEPRGNLEVVELPHPESRGWWPPRRWFAPDPVVRLRVRFALGDSGRDYILAGELEVSTTAKVRFIDADSDRMLAQTTFAAAKTMPLNDGSPEEFELVIDVDAADIPRNAGLVFLRRSEVYARVLPNGHHNDGPVPGDPVQLTAKIVAQLDGQPINVDAMGVRIHGHVNMQALDPLKDTLGPTLLRMSLTLPAPVTYHGQLLIPYEPVILELDPTVPGWHPRFGDYKCTLEVFLVDAQGGETFPYVSESVTPVQSSSQSIPSAFELVLNGPYLFAPEKLAIALRLIHSGGELTILGSVQPAGSL
jgi:hypothetical protein